MLKIKNMLTEMKIAFGELISRLGHSQGELKNKLIETSQTEKQREKRKKNI